MGPLRPSRSPADPAAAAACPPDVPSSVIRIRGFARTLGFIVRDGSAYTALLGEDLVSAVPVGTADDLATAARLLD